MVRVVLVTIVGYAEGDCTRLGDKVHYRIRAGRRFLAKPTKITV